MDRCRTLDYVNGDETSPNEESYSSQLFEKVDSSQSNMSPQSSSNNSLENVMAAMGINERQEMIEGLERLGVHHSDFNNVRFFKSVI